MVDNISRSDPKRAFTMLQTMIDENNISPSQISEIEQDNSFLGFHNCINSC